MKVDQDVKIACMRDILQMVSGRVWFRDYGTHYFLVPKTRCDDQLTPVSAAMPPTGTRTLIGGESADELRDGATEGIQLPRRALFKDGCVITNQTSGQAIL